MLEAVDRELEARPGFVVKLCADSTLEKFAVALRACRDRIGIHSWPAPRRNMQVPTTDGRELTLSRYTPAPAGASDVAGSIAAEPAESTATTNRLGPVSPDIGGPRRVVKTCSRRAKEIDNLAGVSGLN